jgi:hypothetical protein
MKAEHFKEYVFATLAMEEELTRLGETVINTAEGPYALAEQALWEEKVPEQKAYSELKSKVKARRSIIDAYDVVARFELAQSANP